MRREDRERLRKEAEAKAAGPRTANLEDLARETISESDAAVPTPGKSTGAAPTGEPVDAWGRKFAADLHQVKLSDKTAPVIRGGKLLCLPGKGLGDAPRVTSSETPKAGVDHLDLEAGGADTSTGAADDASVDTIAAGDEVAAAAASATAASDAELMKDLTLWLGVVINPDMNDPSKDGPKIQTRWERAFTDKGWSLPVDTVGLAVWASGKHVIERAVSEKGLERIRGAWNWLSGKKPEQETPIRTDRRPKPAAPAPDPGRAPKPDPEDDDEAPTTRSFSSLGLEEEVSL